MATAMKCDRCGTYFDVKSDIKQFEKTYPEAWRFSIYKDCHPYGVVELDLCNDCKIRLYKWMKMEG